MFLSLMIGVPRQGHCKGESGSSFPRCLHIGVIPHFGAPMGDTAVRSKAASAGGTKGSTARVSIQPGSVATVPKGDDHLCLGVRFERIRVQKKTSSCTRRSAERVAKSQVRAPSSAQLLSANFNARPRPSWPLSVPYHSPACGTLSRAATSKF